MATITLAQLMNAQAAQFRNSTGTRLTPADFVINGISLLLLGNNTARRKIERAHDFQYSDVTADLSIASSGSNLSAATVSGSAVEIKRIQNVLLPIAGGAYVPIEYLTDDAYTARRARQIGRQAYDAALTAAQYGIAQQNPLARLHGATLGLEPADQFTFPVSAKLEIVKFLPDYTGASTLTLSGNTGGTAAAINTDWEQFGTYNDRPFYFNFQSADAAPAVVYALWYSGTAWVLTEGQEFGTAAASPRYSSTSTAQSPVGLTFTATVFTGTLAVAQASGNVSSDFILENGWDYLLWQGVLETNRLWKEFVPRQEGNIDEEAIQTSADRALAALIAWDNGIRTSTTTPTVTNQ